jgi:hypothetical protein
MPTSNFRILPSKLYRKFLNHLTVHLPQVLIISGSQQGRAGLNSGLSNIHDPVFYSALYSPQGPNLLLRR